MALGYKHYGYPGKVNTKKHRAMLRKLRKHGRPRKKSENTGHAPLSLYK
jgi:hypothetical protein